MASCVTWPTSDTSPSTFETISSKLSVRQCFSISTALRTSSKPGSPGNSWVNPTVQIQSWLLTFHKPTIGGIILENNPLECDCNLLWISRWMKEIFTEMKSINVEAAIHVKSALSLSRCRMDHQPPTLGSNASAAVIETVPIVHLQEEDIGTRCDNQVAPSTSNAHGCLFRYHHPIYLLLSATVAIIRYR